MTHFLAVTYLPIALAEIISKAEECCSLFVTPFHKLNYHVMKVIYTLAANNLQNNPGNKDALESAAKMKN